jgi:hypothetical protein
MSPDIIDRMREDAARVTQRGVGMPIAGGLFWVAFALFGARLSPERASLYAFIATGAVFPLGWWLIRVLGGDLMAKGPLGGLGGLLNAVQFFYWPVLFAVYAHATERVPFTMAVLFVSHFLPYGWYYRSRGYALLGIAGPASAVVLQIVAAEHAFVAIPLAMAAWYALAVLLLLRENRALPAAVATHLAETA